MKWTTAFVLLCSVAGCGWNTLPYQGSVYIDQPLWNAAGVVVAENDLYVPLPYSGGLALVQSDGTSRRVDIGEGRLNRLQASPTGSSIIAIVDRYSCDVDDPREQRTIKDIRDCPYDELQTVSSVELIRDGDVTQTIDVSGSYNNITFSDDDRFAIAFLDSSDPDFSAQGVVDLTSVMVLDLQNNTATAARVGFSANRVLFTYDADGQANRAVVLSQNTVAVVDLFSSPPAVDVTFPLTLDPDSSVTPVGVELTPDGQYALISVAGKSDLYALDLINHSVNMIELSGTPAAMVVNEATDQTLLVFSNAATAEVLTHDYFDVNAYDLDESMNQIIQGDDFALLYSDQTNRNDLYHLDLATEKLIEYRLQQSAVSVHLAPTQDYAIALTRSAGMEVIDLANERQQQFALEGVGVGISFSATDTSLHALLLQQETEYLYKYELYSGQAEEIELSAPPKAIGTLADGTFFITHVSGNGLITFLNPDSGTTLEAAGFATIGLLDTVELQSREED